MDKNKTLNNVKRAINALPLNQAYRDSLNNTFKELVDNSGSVNKSTYIIDFNSKKTFNEIQELYIKYSNGARLRFYNNNNDCYYDIYKADDYRNYYAIKDVKTHINFVWINDGGDSWYLKIMEQSIPEVTTGSSGLMPALLYNKFNNIITTGDGTKYLSDDGTYKTIESGESGTSGVLIEAKTISTYIKIEEQELYWYITTEDYDLLIDSFGKGVHTSIYYDGIIYNVLYKENNNKWRLSVNSDLASTGTKITQYFITLTYDINRKVYQVKLESVTSYGFANSEALSQATNVATSSSKGLMSATDKTNLTNLINRIQTGGGDGTKFLNNQGNYVVPEKFTLIRNPESLTFNQAYSYTDKYNSERIPIYIRSPHYTMVDYQLHPQIPVHPSVINDENGYILVFSYMYNTTQENKEVQIIGSYKYYDNGNPTVHTYNVVDINSFKIPEISLKGIDGFNTLTAEEVSLIASSDVCKFSTSLPVKYEYYTKVSDYSGEYYFNKIYVDEASNSINLVRVAISSLTDDEGNVTGGNVISVEDKNLSNDYVLSLTLTTGTNTGTFDDHSTVYNDLVNIIENNGKIVIKGEYTRDYVQKAAYDSANSKIVLRWSVNTIGDDDTSVTVSIYEVTVTSTDYTTKVIHKTI